MDCVELQQILAEVEDGTSVEQRAHLRACPACSALCKELSQIIAAASQLQEADEPSPRVWNNIEIALRQEGLIRPQRPNRSLIPPFGARWGAARWLVPAAAMLLLSLGVYVRQHSESSPVAQEPSVNLPASNLADLNDDDFLQEVAVNAPALKPQYEDNLRRVNESIRDAQGLVDESPNDSEARRSLMDAYHQKSMLFEMAMNHSLQ
jgi:hypothetical protein